MRVLFFLSSLQIGGAEVQTIQLVSELRRKGCDVQVLVHHPRCAGSMHIDPSATHIHFLDGFRMRNPAGWLRAWRAMRAVGADVVVPVNTTPAVVCAIGRLCGAIKARVLCTFHTTQLVAKEGLQFKLFRLAVRVIDSLIFVSENQKAHWDLAGLRPRSAEVIHNGVDTERFSVVAPLDRMRQRQALGIPPDAYVVGICAALRPEKNHLQLVDAVATLRTRGIPAWLLVVGDGAQRDVIVEKITQKSLESTAILVGRQQDVRPYIAAIDVGVLCSTSETFSLAALEILSAGIPMVMSNVGGASEMVADDVNGYLFSSGDLMGLVGALEKIYEVDLRKRLASRAAREVRDRFTQDQMVDKYVAAFQKSVMRDVAVNNDVVS